MSARPWYLGATHLATLPWLIRLRRATAAIELLLLAIAFGAPRVDLPLDHVAALMVLDAMGNVAVARSLARRGAASPALSAAAIVVQVLLLTGLLELTGGPSNPFSVVYALQIAMAALTLGRPWALLIGVEALATYSLLIDWHVHELVPVHHRLNDFPTHLFTMWFSAGIAAELVGYFVVQASDALLAREQALAAMQLRAERSERLASVTTLAAGAAHELSTPLATIALAARELEHVLERRAEATELTSDVRLIRGEVDRCQAILDQMSGRAGGAAADQPEWVVAAELLDEVRRRLDAGVASRLAVGRVDAAVALWTPRAGLVQALSSLVKNAFDATSGSTTPIVVEVVATESFARFTIQDRGPGLTPEAQRRAGEPFYTTKEPGRGLGLGLFLARIFTERQGGSLTLQSRDGTTAILELPLAQPAPEEA